MAGGYQNTSNYAKGNGWHQARQRLEYLESTVAAIKVRHDAEIEREKNKQAEDDRIKKEKEDEERRAKEKLEREELNKSMMDNMNKRLVDIVCLALSGKRLDEIDLSHRAEALRVTVLIAKTQTNDDVLAKLMAEQERMKVQLDEAAAARRRLEKMEQEIQILRQSRDDAKVEAEAWRQEAIRPGSKRG
ncbi:hypothetical protein CBR_g29948 [Chara braunii]|uniref:Uncharacterized protein n=1 Tax=Chara braunii TaxID=69332 RepID=A0A388LBW8_CHABU|nr:hypothetical protein CBR_g29948 [Chara braunii]|eukprot:GBG79683.1 hypothetical protein CBR_g29948 [Chara braunii]